MLFEDTWGQDLIKIILDTDRLPYRLTERYGNAVRTRRFWSRLNAEHAHSAALANARDLIAAVRDARPLRRVRPMLRVEMPEPNG